MKTGRLKTRSITPPSAARLERVRSISWAEWHSLKRRLRMSGWRVHRLATLAALLVLATAFPAFAQTLGNLPVAVQPGSSRQATLKVDNSTAPNRVSTGCETDQGGVGGATVAGSTAVNGLRITGGATGAPSIITAQPCASGDANPGLQLQAFGTGTLTLGVAGNTVSFLGTPSFAGAVTFGGLITQNGGEVTLFPSSPVSNPITATLKSSPVRIFSNNTDVATPGTVLANLYTFTLPGNGLQTVGQSLHIKAAATVAANANNKTWALTFGATTIWTSTAAAFNNTLITIDCDLFMTGATAQKAICNGQSNTLTGVSLTINAGSTVSTPAETLSGAVVINFQGTTPTSAGDLTARFAYIDLYPNGQ